MLTARDYLAKALQAARIASALPDWRDAQGLMKVAEDYLRLAEAASDRANGGKPLKGTG
jgi:hypothetical protein